MKKYFVITAVFLFSVTSYSQYFGDQVLQKSFDQENFFFTPSLVNPYGVKGFAQATSGFVNDPLLNLQRNPAHGYADTSQSTYAYIDFRTGKKFTSSMIMSDVRVQPMLDIAQYSIIPYPYSRYYTSVRNELEPVVSTAVLTRPLPSALPQLSIGVSYQMLFQDDKYYMPPSFIYVTNYGYDGAGVRLNDANSSIPTYDTYNGQNNMHQSGHFISVYSGYELSNDVRVGMKLARATYDKNGAYGNNNMWNTVSSPTNVRYNIEERTQNYQHWDLSAGAEFALNEKSTGGISAGYLWGDVQQRFGKLDTSLYTSGTIGLTTNWNYNHRYSSTEQRWKNSGKTYYVTTQFKSNITAVHAVLFSYEFSRSDVAIALASNIGEESIYQYRNQYNSTVYSGDSKYTLSDVRSGSGNKQSISHRIVGALEWNPNTRTLFTIGMIFQKLFSETITDEPVAAGSQSSYLNSNGTTPTHQGSSQEKTLRWNFISRYTTVQIPMLMQFKTGDKIAMLLGLNRKISSWEIDDITTATYTLRIQTDGQKVTQQNNFAERSTMPKESMSDVTTYYVMGVTITPSPALNVRVLFTPYTIETSRITSELNAQWLIGVQLTP